MAKRLLGKQVAEAIDDETDELMNLCKREPALSIIRVGDDSSAISYESNITKKCNELGIKCASDYIEEYASDMDVINAIRKLDDDKFITGILLCCPLPPKFDQATIKKFIIPYKDVDGAGTNVRPWWRPCTAQACIEILRYYKIPIAGKRAVIVGRSDVVGKPVAEMLLDCDATVTICHSKTSNLDAITREADILISAAGKPGLITDAFVRPGQTVIDVGMNRGANGKMCGDVNYFAVAPIVDAITPVPGGVGVVTTSILVQNVVNSACDDTVYKD